jgi:hypothetical protein
MLSKIKKYYQNERIKTKKNIKENKFYHDLKKKYNIKKNKKIFSQKIFIGIFSLFSDVFISFSLILLTIFALIHFNIDNNYKEEPIISYKENIYTEFNNIYSDNNKITYDQFSYKVDSENFLKEIKDNLNFYSVKENEKELIISTNKLNQIVYYKYSNNNITISDIKNKKNENNPVFRIFNSLYKYSIITEENNLNSSNEYRYNNVFTEYKKREHTILNFFLLIHHIPVTEYKYIIINNDNYQSTYMNQNLTFDNKFFLEDEVLYQKNKQFFQNLFYLYIFSLFMAVFRFYVFNKRIEDIIEEEKKYILEQANKKKTINTTPYGNESFVIKPKNIISL